MIERMCNCGTVIESTLAQFSSRIQSVTKWSDTMQSGIQQTFESPVFSRVTLEIGCAFILNINFLILVIKKESPLSDVCERVVECNAILFFFNRHDECV